MSLTQRLISPPQRHLTPPWRAPTQVHLSQIFFLFQPCSHIAVLKCHKMRILTSAVQLAACSLFTLLDLKPQFHTW